MIIPNNNNNNNNNANTTTTNNNTNANNISNTTTTPTTTTTDNNNNNNDNDNVPRDLLVERHVLLPEGGQHGVRALEVLAHPYPQLGVIHMHQRFIIRYTCV